MIFFRKRYILLISFFLLNACFSDKEVCVNPALENLKIGVIGVIQPMGSTDLLAGYIPENRVLATEEDLVDFNIAIIKMLKEKTKHTYIFIPAGDGADPTVSRVAGENSALQHWVVVGKKMNVDMIIIPYILNWHQREGGSAGATSSAELVMDYFLVDVRGGGVLLSRSHYKEKQESLATNLLALNLFIKRGGKWVKVEELANEAMKKMINDFCL